ncbi:MAG: hypothetical protein L6290_06530 [Thermodesulfovibrionales bacterium]|nr:hypothetical protein [Thermodesulfovibrionales bacterium]
MKRRILVFMLTFTIMFVGIFSNVYADTILFPVIAVNQPNVTTIVSVFNRPGFASTHLHFIYRMKCTYEGCAASGTPNYEGVCLLQSFTRTTYNGDLVSFDASGVLNGGNALFNDPNTYDGTFHMSSVGANRAYLLVRNSNSTGSPVSAGATTALGGEAIVMDIATGAAWGYRAVNDTFREDYEFTQVGVTTAITGGGTNCKWFSFFPPNEWTTRFFITPIGDDMDIANLSTTVALVNDASGMTTTGVISRAGSKLNFTKPVDATCTAGIDLVDMMDSTTFASIQNTGGWAWLCEQGVNPITAYKLEYVVNNPVYGGTNNNGYLMSIGNDRW